MSAAPSEPEKYSIDEMMNRLKTTSSSSPEEGERVIRADGTEAIRVRKRKRRSNQPIKEQRVRTRRARILQISGVLALLILFGVAAGGALVYANSPPFRAALVDKITRNTGASADLQMFRMNPKTANADSLALKWPGGNVLDQLKLRGLTAEIFPISFLGKTFKGEEITVTEGSLSLKVPDLDQPARASSSPSTTEDVQFRRYRIPQFEITLGPDPQPSFKISKTEGSLSFNPLNGRTQFSLNRGDISLPGWPKMRLDRAFLEIRGEEIDIVGLRLQHETDNRGRFELTGTLVPYSPERLSTLSVEMESFPLSGLVGAPLGRFFSGKVDSLPVTRSNYFSFYPSRKPSPKLSISFRSSLTSSIELMGFPFLLDLAQTLEDDWYHHPVFMGQDVTGNLRREANSVTLEELDFESKGRMALKGSVSMTDNNELSGQIQVGVAEAMILAARASSSKDRMMAIFSTSEAGFRWVTIKLGGTSTNPEDNFKELLAQGTASSAPKDPTIEADSSFESLTRPR